MSQNTNNNRMEGVTQTVPESGNGNDASNTGDKHIREHHRATDPGPNPSGVPLAGSRRGSRASQVVPLASPTRTRFSLRTKTTSDTPQNRIEIGVETDANGDIVMQGGESANANTGATLTPEQIERARVEAADAEYARQVAAKQKADEDARNKALQAQIKKEKQEEEIRNLREELAERSRQKAGAQTRVKDLKGQNLEIQNHNSALQNELDTLHLKVEAQRKRLNGSRAFAAREGNVDAQALIQLFTDFTGTIDDFSYIILSGLNDQSDAVLKKEELKRIRNVMGKTKNVVVDGRNKIEIEEDENVYQFLKIVKNPTPMDISDPLIQYLFTKHLYEHVFQPFSPRMDKNNSDILQSMYTDMRKKEPQERSAKWRALTYRHTLLIQTKQNTSPPPLDKNPPNNNNKNRTNPAPKETAKDRNAASDDDVRPFMDKVTDLLRIFNRDPKEEASDELWKAAKHSFSMALKVQEKAKTEYTSFDYEVAFYGGAKEQFNRGLMEVVQGPKGAQSVYLTVGLGLNAKKSVRRDGKYEDDMTTPVKAKVVCENWEADFDPDAR